MGWHDDDGFTSFLQELITLGKLNEPAQGITKLVIDKGQTALKGKQIEVFQRYVLDTYTRSECSKCGSNIPWSEMLHAYDNDWKCSWCLKMEESRGKD